MSAQAPQDTIKPTIKELLDRHNITYFEFYEHCTDVPSDVIDVMYKQNTCIRKHGERMIAFINREAGTSYTLDDVFTKEVY